MAQESKLMVSECRYPPTPITWNLQVLTNLRALTEDEGEWVKTGFL